jgi:tetratricopeptide (TPR) repeat protein
MEALAAYEQALRLDPYDTVVYWSKGVILHNLKRYEEELVAYETALLYRLLRVSILKQSSQQLSEQQ